MAYSNQQKCVVSPRYGKDENKTLHFYCENCGKEMYYDEDRICGENQPPTSEWEKELHIAMEEVRPADWYYKFIKRLIEKAKSEAAGEERERIDKIGLSFENK